MIGSAHTLARRYARAFVRAFNTSIDLAMIDRIANAADYLRTHKKAILYLALPCIDNRHKYQMLEHMCNQLNVSTATHKLILLLMQHKRITLLADVFDAIQQEFYATHAIQKFTIESFPTLEQKQITAIQQTLSALSSCTVIYTYREQPALIAGIRAQSAHYLYESSIAARLRIMRQQLLTE